MLPAVLNELSSELAITSPATPPLANAPPHGRHAGPSPNAVQTLANNAKPPIVLINGASIARERIHFHPIIQSSIGRTNADSPNACNRKSASHAPAKPVRLWARVALAATSHDGSSGL